MSGRTARTVEISPADVGTASPQQADTDYTNTADAFLTRLDDSCEDFCFFTITPANGVRPIPRHYYGPPDAAGLRLHDFNEQGADVFVVINETNGQGAKDADITRIRAVFADDDKERVAYRTDWPLEPHLIVESSPGKYHYYWMVEGLPVDEFKGIQQAIAHRHGTDPAVSNPARLMRLPGFINQKRDKKGRPKYDEFRSRIVSEMPSQSYRADEIRGAFPPQLPDLTKVAKPRLGSDEVIEALAQRSLYLRDGGNGKHIITCPWAGEHSDGRAEAAYFEANTNGYAGAAFKCQHAHCLSQSIGNLRRYLSVSPPSECGKSQQGYIDAFRGWSEPVPLVTFSRSTPYPIAPLPEIIQGAVLEVHEFVQSPISMIATSALGALSVAAQGLVNIHRAETLTGPVSLFALTIAESGERKSTIDRYFTGAIREFEAEQKEALFSKIRASKTDQSVWEAKRAGLIDKIKTQTRAGKSTDTFEDQLHELEAREPTLVRAPYLIRTDETPEHLAIALRDEWPSAGIISSEAGAVFGSHGMNADSVMRTLSQLNVLWDGGELQVGRITRESFRLHGVRLTISLQAQPQTLTEFLQKHGALARGNGFLARFLIAWPESTQGYRPMADPPAGWPALTRFCERIRQLLETPLPLNDEGRIVPLLLKFDPSASREWRNFYNDTERQLRPGGSLYEIRDAASKLADNMARIAALLHVFEDGAARQVTVKSVRAAIAIASWHIEESRRFLGSLSLPEEIRLAMQLEKWMVARCSTEGEESVSTRCIAQYGPTSLRRKNRLDPVLQRLVDHGRCQISDEGRQRLIHIHPSLLEV